MTGLRTIYRIARADLLERVRQFSFLVIIGITIMIAYFFIPPSDGGYATLYLDHYRGIYNSAWVGASAAISTTLFLSFFGFFLVKNNIRRDEQTGFGQIIASTPVSKLSYLLGKAVSSYAVLSIITGAVILTTVIMQLVRSEVLKIELWKLISPFLFLTLPVMAVVSALAVLFETGKALRGVFGNIIYFAMYIASISLPQFIPYGTNIITDRMVDDLTVLHPDYSGSFGIGVLSLDDTPIQLFEWQGIHWSGGLIGQQLTLFLYAFLVVLAAAVLFRRFREASLTSAAGNKQKKSVQNTEQAASDTASAYPGAGLRAAALSPVSARNSFSSLVIAEWRLMMKGTALGWYVVAGVLIILGLFMPLRLSGAWMIWPLTWIWPLAVWSGMGCREHRFQTQYLVASSPRFVSRQLTAVYLSGVLLTCMTGTGMLIRFILEGDIQSIAYWISAALLIPSLALAAGVLTGTNRTFEVLYMIIWYLGPFNKVPLLDFLGTESAAGTSRITEQAIYSWVPGLMYIIISLGLLSAAYLTRSRLTRRV